MEDNKVILDRVTEEVIGVPMLLFTPKDKVIELFEAYHQAKLKQLAPSDEEIDARYPERNDSGTRLDINMGRREGAKWMRDQFINPEKQ